jgi:hypothetical protein
MNGLTSNSEHSFQSNGLIVVKFIRSGEMPNSLKDEVIASGGKLEIVGKVMLVGRHTLCMFAQLSKKGSGNPTHGLISGFRKKKSMGSMGEGQS